METETCPRCGGTGNIPAYSHRWGGVCLLCKGRGTIRQRRTARQHTPINPPAVPDFPPHPDDCDCPFHW
jgi:DnaJ-class molecular chaperone